MKFKKVFALLTLFLILLSNVSAVYAKNKKTDEAWEKRRAFIEENISVIGNQGPEKVDEWLQANGVYKVKDIQTVQAASSPGSVSLYNIDGYFDGISKKYIVKGWWTWNGINLVDPTTGAVDSVSLAMCKTDWNPVTGYVFASNPAGIAVYDQDGTHYPYAGGASSIDKSGVVYIFQDSWNANNKYCGYKGQAWFWLTTVPSQSPIYLRMNYVHTWTAANLTSFGFNWPVGTAPTINLQFNTTPENFPQANQVTLYSWRYVN